jgi:hypothetical protein
METPPIGITPKEINFVIPCFLITFENKKYIYNRRVRLL